MNKNPTIAQNSITILSHVIRAKSNSYFKLRKKVKHTPKAAKPNITTRKFRKSHKNMYAYTSAVTRAPGARMRRKN